MKRALALESRSTDPMPERAYTTPMALNCWHERDRWPESAPTPFASCLTGRRLVRLTLTLRLLA
jgi:hypothetical protein